MSGHNKWTQIKRKKGVTDQKRGQIFSKLLRAISVAAKEGTNPTNNTRLKSIIDKARDINVPLENIERAINKSSEIGDVEDLIIEAYGPEGIAILIEAQTNNRNRTISEIKKILSDHEAKWADPGSVLWAFEKDSFSPHEYHAKFPQKISDESEKKIIKILDALDEHDDVLEVYTNEVLNES
ncbi:MAG TPA: YebC/PmpR family DNA-binding transcriptional regulator [Candidatus Paceibacterota bacterium]|nr:YebC/PmpR family DNA-binding transcriptional regulator [Candidatus Paceibacterota bacterium]